MFWWYECHKSFKQNYSTNKKVYKTINSFIFKKKRKTAIFRHKRNACIRLKSY